MIELQDAQDSAIERECRRILATSTNLCPESAKLIELAIEAQRTGKMPNLELLEFDFPPK